MKQDTTNSKQDDFATMYEQSLATMENFKPGQLVETTIVSIAKDCIFLQLGGKSEGILERDELADQDGQLSVKEGDSIKVYFLQSRNGELRFTTKISGDKAGSAMLEQAYLNKIPVEGLIEKEIKGGFEIKLGETRAFCPYSQMGPRRSEQTAAVPVGKHLTFKIIEYKENGRKILVSNRIIHEEAQQAKVEALKNNLRENMVVKGVITSLQDFGAFVDLEGVQALLPISEIGRARVEDIHTLLSVGQEIEASVLKLDWKNQRISLSMKRLLADPWEQAIAKYPVDSKHTGTVARLADFGAFVTLEPGLDGLVHNSELRTGNKYSNSQPTALKVGQSLTVQILGVDRANRRIALKPASSQEEDQTAAQYMDKTSDSDTYNPFAALLKKK
ncbi:MAG: 30S ribosomal protein S1 [Spirochaetes bacterium GWD1_61_31]|nr:MAG: 30S ribosomal protein S1 [Spirochaetes bacterium GWB1_60_80]OHD31680.1 MAG: 30S ribosomal protein S1 [Spirochaetes bacterium GWC1_61_12]OHD41477.1 MAG: 30S ribosomal protein S1 [Spirochaetes bacterium GWE1_60_18]OHD41517.1 MAG: 30S ribosomal protein S1 [Spirochaetes bacterium GWD1_61_31]OHD61379.1 MAG: 30S ribosomal protein S1 [Spirochaetes bacterium GWF1_60_12]